MKLLKKEILAPSLTLFKLYVPDIAKKVKAGQFVVLRVDDYAERIPLTVAEYNRKQVLSLLYSRLSDHPTPENGEV